MAVVIGGPSRGDMMEALSSPQRLSTVLDGTAFELADGFPHDDFYVYEDVEHLSATAIAIRLQTNKGLLVSNTILALGAAWGAVLFVTLTFSPGLPILVPLTSFAYMVRYGFDKVAGERPA